MNPVVGISTASDGNMYDRHNDTDPVVIHNREVFLQTLGSDLDRCVRVHVNALVRANAHETNWCRYREVSSKDAGQGMRDSLTEHADALVTTTPGLALMLPVADCIGAALYDPTNNVLMVSHLGRHSLEQQGAAQSIDHLVSTYGSNPRDIKIWLTPAAGKEHFPIWALNNQGMKEIAFSQFAEKGVSLDNITDNPADTTTDASYFSYSEFLKGNRPFDADYAIVAMLSS